MVNPVSVAAAVAAFLQATWLIVGISQPFLGTIVLLGMVVTLFIAVGRRSGWETAAGVSALVSLISFLVVLLAAAVFGDGIGTVAGTTPPTLLALAAVPLALFWVFEQAGLSGLSGHSYHGGIILLVLVSLVGAGIMLWILNGGSFANVGGLVGQAGYGISSALSFGPVKAAYSTVSSPFGVCNNRRMAELQCTADLYFEGKVFEAAAGSASVSECVKKKIKKKCGTATESKKVTEPIVVKVGDPTMEPLRDHVRFFVPVTNTLVTDRQGRPILITAEAVNVSVSFKYLGKTVASAAKYIPEIQNGDTASIEFNTVGGADDTYVFPGVNRQQDFIQGADEPYIFPRFTVTSNISSTTIQEQLLTLEEECSGDDAAAARTATSLQAMPGGGCKDATNWFEHRFDRPESPLSEARVGFHAKTPLDVEDEIDVGAFPQVFNQSIQKYLGGNIIAPNKKHDVAITVEYNYTAEAAFTKSSRWQSGNHLLKVWRQEAWDQLSPDEREQWRSSNCQEITRAGTTFRKQRTAALTTPVIPVMYADCGGALFNGFNADNDYTGDIPIQFAATINEDLKDQFAKKGFKITGATTDCVSGAQPLTFEGDTQEGWYKRGRDGFSVPPQTRQREDVTVEGQRKTIGCSLSMNLTVQLRKTATFQGEASE